jgi:hypothetical protein
LRYSQAERLRGLQVDHQLELGRQNSRVSFEFLAVADKRRVVEGEGRRLHGP